jgi:hypothetical protein
MSYSVAAFHTEIYQNVFTLPIPMKEGIGGESRPEDRVKRGLLYG